MRAHKYADEPLRSVETQHVQPVKERSGEPASRRRETTGLRSHCHLQRNARCWLPRLQYTLSTTEVVSRQLDGSRAYAALQIRIAASDAESTTSGRCCIRSVLAGSMDRGSQPAVICPVATALHGEPVYSLARKVGSQAECVYPLRMVRRRLDGDKVHDGKCMGTAGNIGDMDEGDIVVTNARTL